MKAAEFSGRSRRTCWQSLRNIQDEFPFVLTMILSFVARLFVVRQLKILCERDVERFQVVRAVALVTMAITPYHT
jgi:hypothetical protein